MSDKKTDEGIIMVLLDRFENQRLPRILKLHELVFQGEKLNDSDIAFLEEVLETAQEIQTYVDKYPSYEDFYTRIITLYSDITEKALENEKKAQ